MKFFNILVGAGLFVLSSTVFASTITTININDVDAGILDGTDVGYADALVIQADKGANSNPETETAWVNQYISGDAEYIIKTEDVVYYDTTVADVFAFELGSTSTDYFLVKNSTRIALFRNGQDFEWGVFDSRLLEGFNIPSEEFTISHVTEFDTDGRTVVPVPPAVWLFGSGLLGLVGVARRKDAV